MWKELYLWESDTNTMCDGIKFQTKLKRLEQLQSQQCFDMIQTINSCRTGINYLANWGRVYNYTLNMHNYARRQTRVGRFYEWISKTVISTIKITKRTKSEYKGKQWALLKAWLICAANLPTLRQTKVPNVNYKKHSAKHSVETFIHTVRFSTFLISPDNHIFKPYSST